MKYNFDTVHDRVNDPYSYSMKYASKRVPSPANIEQGFETEKMPDDTIVLFLADMDFDIAPPIIEACQKAAAFPNYGYTAPKEDYFEAVQRWFKVHYDWDFATDDIYVCSGTHPGVAEAIRLCTNPGAGVIVFTPSYPFHSDVEAQGRKYVSIDFKRDGDTFSVDWEAFEAAAKDPNNEAFIIVQPHNPLGFVYSVEDMKRIADICRQNGLLMIADMVHLDISRAGVNPVPFPKAVGTENVVALTGLAKTFNISGLSMSNMIVADPAIKEKLKGRFVQPTPFGIAATTAAYTQCDEWVSQLNEYIDGLVAWSVDYLSKNMPKLHFTRPDATYVLYLDFSGYGLTSEELDKRIAGKAHLLLSNGTMCDGPDPTQWRRVCLTAPMATIQEAFRRLKEAFADLEG